MRYGRERRWYRAGRGNIRQRAWKMEAKDGNTSERKMHFREFQKKMK